MGGLIYGLRIVAALALVYGFTLFSYIYQFPTRSALHLVLYFVSMIAVGSVAVLLLGRRFAEEYFGDSDGGPRQ